MPDHDTDPLDVLRAAAVPVPPDPTFAATLRVRLERLITGREAANRAGAGGLARTDNPANQEEFSMPRTEVSGEVLLRNGFSRNGTRTGDVSYITLGVPDLDRARAFYGRVLGWRFSAGRVDQRASQVDDVIPQVGIWSGPEGGDRTARGVVLAFRVDDLDAAIAAVRTQGGDAGDVRQEPYGLTADCRDNQGLEFYRHQLPPAGPEAPENGLQPGDISYISLLVGDGQLARDFYGAVLGWRFSAGSRPDAWQVEGPRPQFGLAGGNAKPAAVLSYQVADLAAAVRHVREAGGSSSDPAERPYGLEASCTDDQGIAFYLHEFPQGPTS